jgi:ABC-type nitrate/sulfonate/bicarbonate transport system substrate-binding protein
VEGFARASQRLTSTRICACLPVLVLLAPIILACSTPKQPQEIRLGISGGTQTLWRYVANRNDELLRPQGYTATFTVFPDEDELRAAFVRGDLDVIGTLLPQVPALAEAAVEPRFFLPIAWLAEGLPLVVFRDAPFQGVEDLEGHRVSTLPLSHPGFAYWRAFALANYGLRLERDWQLVEDPFPESALQSQIVQAAIVASPAWVELRADSRYKLISDLATEWRRFSGSSRPPVFGGYVARETWLASHKTFVADFVRVHEEAMRSFQRDRSAFFESIAAPGSGANPILPATVHEGIAAYLGMDAVGPERTRLTRQDIADYERIFPLLAQAGYLRAAPPSAERLFLLPK